MTRNEVEMWLCENGYEKVFGDGFMNEYEKNGTTVRVYSDVVECYAGELFAMAKHDAISIEECAGLNLGNIANLAEKGPV